MVAKMIMRGCPKCRGMLGLEGELRQDGEHVLEYACVNCGERVYKKVGADDRIQRTRYS